MVDRQPVFLTAQERSSLRAYLEYVMQRDRDAGEEPDAELLALYGKF